MVLSLLDACVPGIYIARPFLLLLDQHSTYYKPDIIAKVMEQNVVILTLPPHSPQNTQPLDVGFVIAFIKHQIILDV